jgi:hypothetical protein
LFVNVGINLIIIVLTALMSNFKKYFKFHKFSHHFLAAENGVAKNKGSALLIALFTALKHICLCTNYVMDMIEEIVICVAYTTSTTTMSLLCERERLMIFVLHIRKGKCVCVCVCWRWCWWWWWGWGNSCCCMIKRIIEWVRW